MTRPNIVRADTIDLQDQDNPTAAEHQKPQFQGGLAPHQRAEVHHVLEERSSEENALADAWNMSGGNLTEEPDTIEETQQQHETTPTTNGTHQNGESGDGGESESDADDDMMDRISSSPSIDDEDIDFEFVYALHTFVATVEGQANATKGDTMVLLDDSNSYWWLVRVVKDSSIGYLPAEHIETPTERLARLNKHRNIDLSATMLSDNSEKTRNPLKKLRRRNVKTVQFAAPTYVEASDYDYETEDEEHAMIESGNAEAQKEEPQQNGVAPEEEHVATETSTEEENARSSTPTRGSFDREQAATLVTNAEDPQTSPKLVDKTEAAPLKSRKGTPRNADSFLKDDSIETRKITLTPGLLREEGQSIKSTSSESTRNNSLESLVKQQSPPEQLTKKDSKKEKKEKKGGMLSGLFKSKKKDKKGAEVFDNTDLEKPSLELRDSPRSSPLPSGRSSPSTIESPGVVTPPDSRRLEVQSRQPANGKLQKKPSNSPSPSREVIQEQQPQAQAQAQPQQQQPSAVVAELQGSEAAHEMAAPILEPIDTSLKAPEQEKPKESPLSPITNILKRDDSNKTQKPTKAKRAKQRVELDDFDSPADEDGPNPFEEQEERAATAAAADADEGEPRERLSESPVEITHSGAFMQGNEIIHIPTPGPYDQPGVGEDDDEEEEPESLTSSPSIIEHPAEPVEPGDTASPEDNDPTPTGPRSPLMTDHQTAAKSAPAAAAAATTMAPQQQQPNRGLSTDSTATTISSHLSPATTVSQQSWSDSSLRAWLEDGSEIKDMMVMIHDKSGVVPVSEDHPLMAGLFTEQKKGVQDLMGQLDGLLGSYLQRKGVSFG